MTVALTEPYQFFVFVVENGICRKCPISANYQDGTIVGVETGLEAGDQVVKSGGGQLSDGQSVVSVNGSES